MSGEVGNTDRPQMALSLVPYVSIILSFPEGLEGFERLDHLLNQSMD